MELTELYPSNEFPDSEREPASHESTRSSLLLTATGIRELLQLPVTRIPDIERYFTVKAF